MHGSILLIDDDASFRFAMCKALARLGFEVRDVESAEAALPLVISDIVPPEVALLDLRMSGGMDGLELLRRCRGAGTLFLVLTGHGTVQAAVEATKLGAFAFLEKPIDADELGPTLLEAVAQSRGARAHRSELPPWIGESNATEAVRRFIARIGPTDETVMISGETGTGKEVVARHIHQASRRASGPFVAFNAGGISRLLFESELFGHMRGAFTGASDDHLGLFREADGGTLFVDEVAELPLDSQAKLLRAVETRFVRPVGAKRDLPVDVRILAATNRELSREVEAGRFREDLYYRLNVVPIVLAPLRARKSDILPLAQHLLARTGRPHELSREAEQCLLNYEWPGNVRELKNVLRRAVLFAEGNELSGDLFRRTIAASVIAYGALGRERTKANPEFDHGPSKLAEVECSHIDTVLRRVDGNRTHAAKLLGINLRTLQRKLRSR